MGIAPHWELWLHLFRAGHTTKPTGTAGTRKTMRDGGYTLSAQLASTNRRWYTSWFYLRNDDSGLPPYTGRIVEDCPEKWRYGVPREEQPKLQSLLDGLERLWSCYLTAAVVVAAFHRRRVLLLMAQRRRLFDMRPGEPIEGVRMSTAALSDEVVLRRVREMVDGKLKSGGLTHVVIRPS